MKTMESRPIGWWVMGVVGELLLCGAWLKAQRRRKRRKRRKGELKHLSKCSIWGSFLSPSSCYIILPMRGIVFPVRVCQRPHSLVFVLHPQQPAYQKT